MEKCVAHGKTDLSMAGYKSLVGKRFFLESLTYTELCFLRFDSCAVLMAKSGVIDRRYKQNNRVSYLGSDPSFSGKCCRCSGARREGGGTQTSRRG